MEEMALRPEAVAHADPVLAVIQVGPQPILEEHLRGILLSD